MSYHVLASHMYIDIYTYVYTHHLGRELCRARFKAIWRDQTDTGSEQQRLVLP